MSYCPENFGTSRLTRRIVRWLRQQQGTSPHTTYSTICPILNLHNHLGRRHQPLLERRRHPHYQEDEAPKPPRLEPPRSDMERREVRAEVSLLVQTTHISELIGCFRIYKGIVNYTAKQGYRADLRQEAVARASAVRQSQRAKKEIPEKKLRGSKAKKAAEKES